LLTARGIPYTEIGNWSIGHPVEIEKKTKKRGSRQGEQSSKGSTHSECRKKKLSKKKETGGEARTRHLMPGIRVGASGPICENTQKKGEVFTMRLNGAN